MEFWEVLEKRRSIRQFRTDREVSKDRIQRLLQAAAASPSAGNRQPWHFYVVRSEQMKKSLSEAAYGQAFVMEAPVVIVVCADPGRSAARYSERGRDLYCIQDTAIAATIIMLAAVDMGLASCWVGAFDETQAAQALRLPQFLRPVAMLTIGYAAKEPAGRTSRRPLSDVVTEIN